MRSFILFLAMLCLPGLMLAQGESKTLSLGAGYADQAWYSLSQGEQSRAALESWDIAFSIQGFAATICVNDAKGIKLYTYPNGDTAAWTSVDTAGMSGWNPAYNSATDWGVGAFNRGEDPTDDFDLGWGVYNFVTHHVTGDSLFVVKFADGSVQKLWLQRLASGVYTFRHGTLDGNMDMTHALDKADFQNKIFGYYSLKDHQSLDQEPAADSWDLLFTKYIDFIPVPYGVTGILTHPDVGVAQVYPVDDPGTYSDFASQSFDSVKNAIGYDWKSFDFSTGWQLQDSLVYFVKDQSGDVWKLVFTDFGGSANGEFTFTQEAMSTTQIQGTDEASFFDVYPNPATRQQVSLLTDVATPGPAQVSLHDLSGRLLQRQRLDLQPTLQRHALSLPQLEPGIYLLRLQQADRVQTTRLMVR